MFEISQLKEMKLPELQEIAKKLSVPKFRTLKKLDLVYQILDLQAANPKAVKEVKIENTTVTKKEAPKRARVQRKAPAPKKESTKESSKDSTKERTTEKDSKSTLAFKDDSKKVTTKTDTPKEAPKAEAKPEPKESRKPAPKKPVHNHQNKKEDNKTIIIAKSSC